MLLSCSRLLAQTTQPIEHARPFIALLDAGHGGIDTGTNDSVSYIFEKNKTLAVTETIMKHTPRNSIHWVPTRQSDIRLTNAERVALIAKYEPDIAISIHFDSSPSSSVHGASIYVLGQEKLRDDFRPFHQLLKKQNKKKISKKIIEFISGELMSKITKPDM